jgi:Ca2+-binding RTX toxin-like protein
MNIEKSLEAQWAEPFASAFGGGTYGSPPKPNLGDVEITQDDSGWDFTGFRVDDISVFADNVDVVAGNIGDVENDGDYLYFRAESVEGIFTQGYQGYMSFGSIHDDSSMEGYGETIITNHLFDDMSIGGNYNTFRVTGWSYDDIEVNWGYGNTVYSGDNDDYVEVDDDAQNTTVFGGDGDDEIFGGDGNDVFHGGDGNDELDAGDGNNQLFGNDGDDDIHAGDGNDRLEGGDGNDDIHGGDGDDVTLGGNGDDYLVGGDGDDAMGGGAGNDYLRGGDGNDTMTDGAGSDHLSGGLGADTFLFVQDGESDTGSLGWGDNEADLVIVQGVGTGNGNLTLNGIGPEDSVLGFASSGFETDLGALGLASGGSFAIGTDTYDFYYM